MDETGGAQYSTQLEPSNRALPSSQLERAVQLLHSLLDMGILPPDQPLKDVQKLGTIAEYGGIYSDIFQGKWCGITVSLDLDIVGCTVLQRDVSFRLL
jgi:hypothetical protein